jgi:hypothetical protein
VPMALQILDNFPLEVTSWRFEHRSPELVPPGSIATSHSGSALGFNARGHRCHGHLPSPDGAAHYRGRCLKDVMAITRRRFYRLALHVHPGGLSRFQPYLITRSCVPAELATLGPSFEQRRRGVQHAALGSNPPQYHDTVRHHRPRPKLSCDNLLADPILNWRYCIGRRWRLNSGQPERGRGHKAGPKPR